MYVYDMCVYCTYNTQYSITQIYTCTCNSCMPVCVMQLLRIHMYMYILYTCSELKASERC